MQPSSATPSGKVDNDMGWKSTSTVTRDEALADILANLDGLSNEALAEMLEIALGGDNHGSNYSVIDNAPEGRVPE